MDVLKPTIGGGGGKLREEFVLHATNRMKIVAVYWVTPSSEPTRKHVNLRIEQYKKNPTDPRFPDDPAALRELGWTPAVTTPEGLASLMR